MALKEEIKRQRKKKNMTQTELANLLGVNLSTVLRWEKGRFMPKLGELSAMAKIFGVMEQDLITPQGVG